MKLILVQGYKCPYCGYSECDKDGVIEHMLHCPKNPDYVQKCIKCGYLETDWETRKLFDGKSMCCYGESDCPYLHHDPSETAEILKKLILDLRDKHGYKEEMKVIANEFIQASGIGLVPN